MKLPSFKKKKSPSVRKFRVDARQYWVLLLSAFVLLLAAELIYFSLSFMRVGTRIEAPATPTLETNETKIKRMQEKLNAVEAAIEARTGTASSQNNSSVVQ